jgi:hypothetical protein
LHVRLAVGRNVAVELPDGSEPAATESPPAEPSADWTKANCLSLTAFAAVVNTTMLPDAN